MQNFDAIENERLLYKTCFYDCCDFLISMASIKMQRLLSDARLVGSLR